MKVRQEKCFQPITQAAVMDEKPDGPSGDPTTFFTALAQASRKLLEWDKKHADELETHLIRHAGTDSTYKHKPELLAALQIIRQRLDDNTLTNSKKAAMLFELTEDIGECTPGFHNRANKLLIEMVRPISLNGYLEKIRSDIVERAARDAIKEFNVPAGSHVHAVNDFFTIANQVKIGVPAPNMDDAYTSDITGDDILNCLNQAFTDNYFPYRIMNSLRSAIEAELRESCGYTGTTSNYPYETMTKIHEHLKNVLGVDDIDFYMLFRIDEKGIATDINWPYIESSLFTKLHNEGYFEFISKDLENFITTPSDPNKPEQVTLDHDITDTLFGNEEKFFEFMQAFNWITPEKKSVLLLEYFKHHKASKKSPDFLKLISNSLGSAWSDDIIHLLQSNNTEAPLNHETLAGLLTAKTGNGSTRLMLACAKNEKSVPNLLKLVSRYDNESQLQILKRTDKEGKNLLCYALKSRSPTLVSRMLALIGNLEPAAQRTLFLQYDVFKDAVRTNSRSIVVDLIQAISKADEKILLNIMINHAVLGYIIAECGSFKERLFSLLKRADVETQISLFKINPSLISNIILDAPEFTGLALDVIKNLPAEFATDFLGHQEIQRNVLKHLALNSPDHIAVWLDLLNHFSIPPNTIDLCVALTCAIEFNQRNSVLFLLDAIHRLNDPQETLNILLESPDDSTPPLQQALADQSPFMPYLLDSLFMAAPESMHKYPKERPPLANDRQIMDLVNELASDPALKPEPAKPGIFFNFSGTALSPLDNPDALANANNVKMLYKSLLPTLSLKIRKDGVKYTTSIGKLTALLIKLDTLLTQLEPNAGNKVLHDEKPETPTRMAKTGNPPTQPFGPG